MTRYGFDWKWDAEHGTWCIYPHHEEQHEDNDFLNALNNKLKGTTP